MLVFRSHWSIKNDHRLEAMHNDEDRGRTNTLELALTASGSDKARVVLNRACSATTGPATSPANWQSGSTSRIWRMFVVHQSSSNPGQDRALASNPEEPHLIGK